MIFISKVWYQFGSINISLNLTKCIYGDYINDGDGKYQNLSMHICMFRLIISIDIILVLYIKLMILLLEY